MSDGFYGGLLAGAVLSVFFIAVDLLLREPIDSIYLFVASAVLGKAALTGGWMPIALGIAMFFLMAAIGGIVFSILARNWQALATTPTSSLAGLVYGFFVWLVFVDIIIPSTGMQQTVDHPLWISAAGIGIFYGSALCEYLANVSRLRKARHERAGETSPGPAGRA
ncbi:MAG: hypothetical protein ACRENA_15955 [Vulcanimicrobiaceae bacterium]